MGKISLLNSNEYTQFDLWRVKADYSQLKLQKISRGNGSSCTPSLTLLLVSSRKRAASPLEFVESAAPSRRNSLSGLGVPTEELSDDLTAGDPECFMSHSATAAGLRSAWPGSCCECFRSVGRRTSCRLATSAAVVADADDSFRRPLLSRGRSLSLCCCWE